MSTPAQTPSGSREFSRTKVYDVLAASPLVLWFALGMYKLLPQALEEVHILLTYRYTLPLLLDFISNVTTLVFFAIVIALVFLRRMPVAKSAGPWPRVIAILGGNLEVALVALNKVFLPVPLQFLSATLSTVGTVAEIGVLIWLGRSYSVFPEARALVTRGPYRWIRHPLYLTAEIATLGIVTRFEQPWAALLALVSFGFQLWRMHNEERVLTTAFPQYREYAARTWRLIPGVY